MPFVFTRCNDIGCQKIPSEAAKVQASLTSLRYVPTGDDATGGQLFRSLSSDDIYLLSTPSTGLAHGAGVEIELLWQDAYYTVVMENKGTGPYSWAATKIRLSTKAFSTNRRAYSNSNQEVSLGGHRTKGDTALVQNTIGQQVSDSSAAADPYGHTPADVRGGGA
jgi:hypothetical protein